MTGSAWRLLAVGLIGSIGVTACVVGSGDDDDPQKPPLGSGGGASITGGAGGQTTETGGQGGSMTGSGGDTGTGGTAASVVCNETGDDLMGDETCLSDTANDDCQACLAVSCCDQVKLCRQPMDQCGHGGPDGDGTFKCFQSCMAADPSDEDACIEACMTPMSVTGDDECVTLGGTTQELIICAREFCGEGDCWLDLGQ